MAARGEIKFYEIKSGAYYEDPPRSCGNRRTVFGGITDGVHPDWDAINPHHSITEGNPYKNFFLWSANSKNYAKIAGDDFNGNEMAGKDGPTCGVARDNYKGILTVNRGFGNKVISANNARFRSFVRAVDEGTSIMIPVSRVKNRNEYVFALGNGVEARKDPDWYVIQKNIIGNIIKLIYDQSITLQSWPYPLYWEGQGPMRERIYIGEEDDFEKIDNYINTVIAKKRSPVPQRRRQPVPIQPARVRRQYGSPRRQQYNQRAGHPIYGGHGPYQRRLSPKDYPYEIRRLQEELRRAKSKNEEYGKRIPTYKQKELEDKIVNLEKKLRERKPPSEYRELETRAKRYKQQIDELQEKLNKCRRERGDSTDVVALKAKVEEYKRKLGENPDQNVQSKVKELEKRLREIAPNQQRKGPEFPVGRGPTGNKDYDQLLVSFQKEQKKNKKCSSDHEKCLREIKKAKGRLEIWTKDMNLFISHFEQCIARNPKPSEKKHISKIRQSGREVKNQIERLEKTL